MLPAVGLAGICETETRKSNARRAATYIDGISHTVIWVTLDLRLEKILLYRSRCPALRRFTSAWVDNSLVASGQLFQCSFPFSPA
jgi:hypothetical protein